LQPEDVIFQVNDTRIRNRNDLFRELSLAAAGENVELGVLRPRTGRSSPLVLTLMASMSKKLVASTRPSYALHSPPVWRGMVVEYATAVPSELTRGGMLAGRQGAPKLAVLSVEPDTPAWNAGLRPGYGILSVNRQAVESPDEFYQQVADANSEVTLTVIRAEQRSEAITVAANPAEPVEQ
jgi:S1-C subfamily serine protease